MSRTAYVVFLVLTAAWILAAERLYGGATGFTLKLAIVWWALVVMAIAAGYYIVQEAPAARVTGWLRRDLAWNGLLLAVLLYAILDGTAAFPTLGLAGAGWIGFAAALLHPVLVDGAHLRHHRRDPAGSPVPQYVPPTCFLVDWTLAAIVLVALLAL